MIGEAMVLLTLTAAVLEKFGGDSLAEVQDNLARYVERITARPEAGGDRSVGGRRPGAAPAGPRGTSAGPGSGGAGPGSGVAGSGGDD